MITFLEGTADLAYILGFALVGAAFAYLWAPLLTRILYKFNIIKGAKTELASLGSHAYKATTPVMGGLLIVITVSVLTVLFNWNRSFTYVPIGVMLISALLGGIDDLMSVYGTERRSRKMGHILNLIRIHNDWKMRFWYTITLPWSAFKRLSVWFGSRTRKGVFVHEKLILQFIAGVVTAWWVYTKLGPAWHYLYIPFGPGIDLSWLVIPVVIFIVMFTANA
ncbi:MAG: hypothetical protein KBC33_02950, partial [Candidatus Pacebacteria bacterium]|nr:hypothetical protein [Candidatus Paceibacterota bacterium]